METGMRVIFHIDVNSAYLSWEAVYRLKHLGGTVDIREIPAVVSGDMAMRHGIILAKSVRAKAYGIHTGESVMEAKKKCPDLLLVPPNYSLYDKASRAFIKILKDYTPDVEQYSIDEAFMDMTGTKGLWGNYQNAADQIREQIFRELGFTVNIGISTNKLLAKMASDFRKPFRTHTLFPEEIPEKMWPLPVSELFFVGKATAEKLFRIGIKTIGELAAADLSMLKARLKKHGELIWGFANGKDVSVVEATPPANKGYGNSVTVPFDVTDAGTAKMVLLALSETVGMRLRKDRVKAGMISVGIKDWEFRHVSHQTVLPSPTNLTLEIQKWAAKLLEERWDGTPIRHLGIHTGHICTEDSPRQTELFDSTNYEALERVDRTVDQIRVRHGIDALKRAVFTTAPIDHMSGGVSREKRTVDYSRLHIE